MARKKVAAKTHVPKAKNARDELDKTERTDSTQAFLRLVGTLRGARDLSSKTGFRRS